MVKVRCTLCDKKMLGSGLGSHMSRVHHKKGVRGVNYVTVAKRGASVEKPQKHGSPKKTGRGNKTVLGPDMQYIEVPAILRIPISMGPIQIVSLDGKEYDL